MSRTCPAMQEKKPLSCLLPFGFDPSFVRCAVFAFVALPFFALLSSNDMMFSPSFVFWCVFPLLFYFGWSRLVGVSLVCCLCLSWCAILSFLPFIVF